MGQLAFHILRSSADPATRIARLDPTTIARRYGSGLCRYFVLRVQGGTALNSLAKRPYQIPQAAVTIPSSSAIIAPNFSPLPRSFLEQSLLELFLTLDAVTRPRHSL